MTITRKEMKLLVKEALAEALMSSDVLQKIVSECIETSVSQILNSELIKESFSTKIKQAVSPNVAKKIIPSHARAFQTDIKPSMIKESERKSVGSEIFKTDDIAEQVKFGKNIFADIMKEEGSRPLPEHLTRDLMEDAEELMNDPRIIKAKQILSKLG